MANILELKNINKIYGEKIKTQVLFDINLNFEESSFNSIIGYKRRSNNRWEKHI